MTQTALMPGIRLTLGGVHLPGEEDPLGVWELAGRDPVAYAAGSGYEGPIWRVELPEDQRAAFKDLRAKRAAVRLRERELERIEGLVARLDLVRSYSLEATAHEDRLLAAITALSSPATAFDTRTEERVNYGALYEQCRALVAQFQALVRPLGRIETVVGGTLVGLTAINLSGDQRTMWSEESAPEQMEAHLAAVRLAMASRQALLRLLVVVVTGALGLAVKAHIPGGQILLLPAVYRFVRDVLQELEHLPEGVMVR